MQSYFKALPLIKIQEAMESFAFPDKVEIENINCLHFVFFGKYSKSTKLLQVQRSCEIRVPKKPPLFPFNTAT